MICHHSLIKIYLFQDNYDLIYILAGKTESSHPVGKHIPAKPKTRSSPGAHGNGTHSNGFHGNSSHDNGPDIRDGLTAMWAKYQNYTSPKKKQRVTFMDLPCVMGDSDSDESCVKSQRKLSKSDSNLNRKRKHSDPPSEDASAAYRATMPTILECRTPYNGRPSGHESESDGDTTTSGSYVVDLEDFNVGLDSMNSSVMV